MAKPITPMVACDVFVLNDAEEVLLVKRTDDGTWCMPGGCQDLTETPAQCAVRECWEESGYRIELKDFLGVFSSRNYPYVHYKFKDDVFVHLLFSGAVTGGAARPSEETSEIGWYRLDQLPLLLDGHAERIRFAYEKAKDRTVPAHYE